MTDFAAQLQAIADQRAVLEAHDHATLADLDAQEAAVIAAMKAAQTPPAPPAPVSVVPTSAVAVGIDGATVTVVAGDYLYGAKDAAGVEHYTKITLPAETVQILPSALGVPDPLYGVVKTLYLIAAAAPAPAPATPPAAPVPAPTPPAPAPAGLKAQLETALKIHCGATVSPTDPAITQTMQIWDPSTKSGGGLDPSMGDPGYRMDLGVITGDCMQALACNLDPHAIASIDSTADCSINWPVHVTDKKTGDMPAKPWLNGMQTFQYDFSNLTPDPQPNPNKLTPDVPHQPHFIAMSAMRDLIMGNASFARRLQEMKAWVSFNHFFVPAQTRGPTGAEGIFDPEASANQPRGAAWGPAAQIHLFNVMCEAKARGVAFVDDGWYAWIKSAVEMFIHYNEHKYHLGDYDESYAVPYYNITTGWPKNDLGVMSFPSKEYGQGTDGQTAIIPAFEQAFQSWVVLWLAKLAPKLDLSATAQSELASLSQWVARWPVMLFGDPATGFPWQYAGQYTIAVGKWQADGSVKFFTGDQMWANNFTTPRPTNNAFYYGTDIASGFGGGYVSNLWPALVYAADLGMTGAAASVARVMGSDQWKAARDFAPPFAVMLEGQMFDSAQPAPAPSPVPAPSPAPGPSPSPAPTPPAPAPGPAPAGFDVTKATKAADENGQFTLKVAADVYYGATPQFAKLSLKAGTYTANNATFGDPFVNTVKAAYVLDANVLGAAPAPTPGPAPSPAPVDANGHTLYSAAPAPRFAPAPVAYAPPAQHYGSGAQVALKPGEFADVVLAGPLTGAPSFYPKGAEIDLLQNWSTGAAITNADGGQALYCTGAGHETGQDQPNIQGGLLLGFAKGLSGPAALSWNNAPSVIAIQNQPYDDHGRFPNGEPYDGHGYQTVCDLPGYPGFAFRLNMNDQWHGSNRYIVIDTTQATNGETTLDSVPVELNAGNKASYYAMVCADHIRGGVWCTLPGQGGPSPDRTIFVKPTRAADGTWSFTETLWPAFSGFGECIFHCPDRDELVSMTGLWFKGYFGSDNYAKVAIMQPGAAPANASIAGTTYGTNDGSFWPNVDYDDWYHAPYQVNAFKPTTPGSGYKVGDILRGYCANYTPMLSNSQWWWGRLNDNDDCTWTVTSVDANGGITGLAFVTDVIREMTPYPRNGYFVSADKSDGGNDGGFAPNMIMTLDVQAKTGSGTDAKVDVTIDRAIAKLQIQNAGFEWVPSRNAAYGFMWSPVTNKTEAIKIARPAVSTDPWIISRIPLTHSANDPQGGSQLANAINSVYGKARYLSALDRWVYMVDPNTNPQIINLP